jgi:hypothetical protein
MTLAEGDSLFVFASAKGDHTSGFDLRITDAFGQELTRAASHEGSRIAVLLEPGPGDYFVEISGTDETDAPYELTWRVLPPCPAGNDALEPNDSPDAASTWEELQEAAAKLPAVQGQPGVPGAPPGGQGDTSKVTALLRICQGDTDYFRLTSKKDDPKVALVLFDHDKGDLDLDLMDASGAEVLETSAQSSSAVPAEGVALPKVEEDGEDTDYILRVRAPFPGTQNFYVLELTTPPPPQEGGEPQEGEQDEEQEPQDQPQDQSEQEREQQPQEEESDPIEAALDQLDRNPRNLEAEQALRNSQLRNWEPEKDW